MVRNPFDPFLEISGFEASVAVGDHEFAKHAAAGLPHRLDRDFADPDFKDWDYSQHNLPQETRDALWDPHSAEWMLRFRTPLRVCTIYKAHDLAEWFLKRNFHGQHSVNAKPQHYSWVAVKEAIYRGDIEMLRLLLSHTEVEPRSEWGRENGHHLLAYTIAVDAARRGSRDLPQIPGEEIVQILREWGASQVEPVRIPVLRGVDDRWESMTALDYAMKVLDGEYAEIFFGPGK